LLSISASGRHASTTIGGGVYEMWRRGQEFTALIVAFCAIAAPGCYILLSLIVLVMVRRAPAPSWVGEVQRWADVLPPWSMNDVLALGILVALTKISELARVDLGIGLSAVAALTVLFAALATTFDAREVWKRIEWVDDNVASPRTPHRTADSAEKR
jgi:paraquat-inducible protein A